MKALIALLASAPVFAVNFGPASTCPTYCLWAAPTTDNPAYTLDWLNAAYALSAPPHTLLSVNGKTYSGNNTVTAMGMIGTHQLYQIDGTFAAADGSVVTVSYSLEYWATRGSTGRITQHRFVDGGSLVVP